MVIKQTGFNVGPTIRKEKNRYWTGDVYTRLSAWDCPAAGASVLAILVELKKNANQNYGKDSVIMKRIILGTVVVIGLMLAAGVAVVGCASYGDMPASSGTSGGHTGHHH